MTGNGRSRKKTALVIRESHFWIGALVLIVLIFGGIWLAIPGADTRHHLTSPSGNISLDVGERCSESVCVPIIVLDFLSPDGERYRNQCDAGPNTDRPVFVNVNADWSEDETQVKLNYTDDFGEGGNIELNLATDCAA